MNQKILTLIIVGTVLSCAGAACTSNNLASPIVKNDTTPSTTASSPNIATSPTTDLEQAVHFANLTQTKGYSAGDFATEGHVILGTEIQGNTTTVYALSSYDWFALENGELKNISGATRVPSVLTFLKNDRGEYVLQSFQEPLGGNEFARSVQKMFPKKFLDDALHGEKFEKILRQQQVDQIEPYLKKNWKTKLKKLF